MNKQLIYFMRYLLLIVIAAGTLVLTVPQRAEAKAAAGSTATAGQTSGSAQATSQTSGSTQAAAATGESTNATTARTLIVSPTVKNAYRSIQAAVNAAKNGDTIEIRPGTYTEAVDCKDKCLTIVGTDRNKCILQYSGLDYFNPPLEMSVGVLKNLTIHATNSGQVGAIAGAYCIHTDWDQQAGGILVIENVKFINDVTSAVGIATRAHFAVTLYNCEITSNGTGPALFMHDWETGGAAVDISGQIIDVRSCTITNRDAARPTVFLHSQEVADGAVAIRFQNNKVQNLASGGSRIGLLRYDGRMLNPTHYLGGSDYILTQDSKGNSDPQMNAATYKQPAGAAGSTPTVTVDEGALEAAAANSR